MNSIFSSLKDGDARERLAVISDLFSVIGVSGAAVLAPLFALKGFLSFGNVLFISILALISLTITSVVLAGMIAFISWLKTKLANGNVRSLLVFAVWTAFGIGFLCLVGLWFAFLSDLSQGRVHF